MLTFDELKTQIRLRDAAALYGCDVRADGMCLCPFHADRHPSMMLYQDHYHCFACGAHGDVLNLTAGLFGLSLKDAAEKLAADFGITTEHPTSKPPAAQQIPHSAHLRTESEWLRHAVTILVQYERLLKQWREQFAPNQPSEELHPLFVEALRQSDRISYLLDMALCSDETERHAFYLNYQEEVSQIERRIENHATGQGCCQKTA